MTSILKIGFFFVPQQLLTPRIVNKLYPIHGRALMSDRLTRN